MYDSIETLNGLFGGAVSVAASTVTVNDAKPLASPLMDRLVRSAVFADDATKHYARWLLWELGQRVGVQPSSIHDLYLARGRGEIHGFTGASDQCARHGLRHGARAIIRTAIQMKAGAFILEIARSEIAYTEQRPAEYVTVILAAALREGFRGPVFIQGDHFQVNAKKYAVDAEVEVGGVKHLATEAIHAGFYNIDIDTSTLVDITKPTLDEQQRLNYLVGVDILKHVRALQPKGVPISIGGEIGEVGTNNSTVEELRAYMDGLNRNLPKGLEGLSKISVQSGTSHGGIVLPDGAIADVKLDLDTLGRLSKVARDEYGLSGAVQHGASTLPDGAFNHFPRVETAEIHLATNFQNMLYDHIPADLKAEIYAWLSVNAKEERKATDSDEQFFYKTRKKALGPFKRKYWDLPADTKATLAKVYDDKFTFLFTQLGIGDTAQHVAKYVHAVEQHRAAPQGATAAVAAAPDDPDAGE